MRILTLPTLIGMAFMGISSIYAEDIQCTSGKTYRNCEILSKDRIGVTFRHDGGVGRVAYKSMSGVQQKRFGYQKEQIKRAILVTGEGPKKVAHVKNGATGKSKNRAMHVYRYGNRYVAAYSSGRSHKHNGTSGYGYGYGYGNKRVAVDPNSSGKKSGAQRVWRVHNPFNRTVSLHDIIRYRNNGYSNITYAGLYNQHFNTHASSHYRGGARNAIVRAPRYLPYVRNIYPRQIGTFGVGPSGGSLVPAMRSGYSTSGSIAPSLVPTRR